MARRADEPVQADPPRPQLGWAIRAARRRVGISISELARRSDLSQSFLSAVEAGDSDISIGRLFRVAQALGVHLPDLVGQTEAAVNVVAVGERRSVPTDPPGLHVELLAPSLDGTRTHAVCTLERGATVESIAATQHESFILVLEGRLRLELAGSSPLELEAGDSVAFRDEQFARMSNLARFASVFQWVSAQQSPAGARGQSRS